MSVFGHLALASVTASEAEQQALQALAPLAKRMGATLILRSNNGRRMFFRNSDNCDLPETCVAYRLLGTSADKQFFVVEEMGYESRTVFWIGRDAWLRQEVYAEPAMSSDRQWIVTANPSEFGGVNGVFVWKISGNRLLKYFRFVPDGYALYYFVRWEKNNSVILEKFTHADKKICPDSQLMRLPVNLIMNGLRWRLDEKKYIEEVICE